MSIEVSSCEHRPPAHEKIPFTFAVSLAPRAVVRNWGLVEALLSFTLDSVRAQTDSEWSLVIACHDRPRVHVEDGRIRFMDAAWAHGDPGPHNSDSGRKKHAINETVLSRGGGFLMILDADDWVDRRLVETARATIGHQHVGGIIRSGHVVHARRARYKPAPSRNFVDLDFHRICGSSTVALLRPDDPDPLRRDPFGVLKSHHQWIEAAGARGGELVALPALGAYLVGTRRIIPRIMGRTANGSCAGQNGSESRALPWTPPSRGALAFAKVNCVHGLRHSSKSSRQRTPHICRGSRSTKLSLPRKSGIMTATEWLEAWCARHVTQNEEATLEDARPLAQEARIAAQAQGIYHGR